MKKPKIRFYGFNDDWEQRKVFDVAEIIAGGTPKTSVLEYWNPKEVPWLSSGEVHKKYITYTDDKISKKGLDHSSAKIIKENSVLIALAGQGKTRGTVAINRIPLSTNQSIAAMIFNDNIVPEFIFSNLDNRYNELRRISSGDGSRGGLNKLLIGNIIIPYTDKLEQDKIGQFFSLLDHLITLHQRKCDEVKKMKKYMLQNMFPQDGEKVPKIRFGGFTDDWEQRKLEDWGTFYYGHSCPKWSVTADATTPCIRYGELYTKFGTKIDRIFSYTNMPTEKLRFSKGKEVLIPRVGEDPMDYNHCTWLSMPDVAIGEMISVFNTEQDPLFTATMFNATLQKEFAMRVEGGSVTNLYFEKLKNIEVSFPKKEEQKKIARFFEEIDNLITLHQRKCDELKNMKKYMLQNMFV